MKKSVIIILGLALMQFGCESPSSDGGGGSGGTGASGGTGGTPGACTEGADCADDNVCTIDSCDPDTSLCANPPVTEETECMFMGAPGLCSEGACAAFCDVDDCSDANDCTQDNCDSMLGMCSNPSEPDDTACMVGTDPGVCQSGECEGLCADEATRCDDNEECTDDSCTPADGMCVHTPRTGQSCDFSGAAGICTDQGVCAAAGLCADVDERCTANADNECTNDTCDLATGNCGSSDVANDTLCAAGAGACQDGACVLSTVDFLAVDCSLLGNAAALPIDSQVTFGSIAMEGVPLDVVPQDTIVLPAELVCGFLVAGFLDAEIANSQMALTMANATPGSAALTDFLDDGSASPALVSPHTDTLFSFATACGCANPTPGDLEPPCGTGPGIVVPFLANAPGADPPGTDPVTITPGSASTVDFLINYLGIALELRNLRSSFTIPALCLGGACAMSACSAENRDSIPGSDSADDSPRIMYDATCDKTQAAAGGCSPFDSFAGIADVCVGRTPTSPVDPADCTDAATCCAALEVLYPTATPAQQPQLPVTP